VESVAQGNQAVSTLAAGTILNAAMLQNEAN
jgi:hypothetical protein